MGNYKKHYKSVSELTHVSTLTHSEKRRKKSVCIMRERRKSSIVSHEGERKMRYKFDRSIPNCFDNHDTDLP